MSKLQKTWKYLIGAIPIIPNPSYATYKARGAIMPQTNKFNNILSDMTDSKLRWCYKKYANKDDEHLPQLVYNLGYYPKAIKELIESRDQNCVDQLTEMLLDVLKNQSTSSSRSEETMICYFSFKRDYGDPDSRSSLGQIYNNITTGYRDGTTYQVRNDGWSLIQKLLNTASSLGYLPTKWVSYIATLMERAKFIAGRKPEDMSKEDRIISTKMFNSVILDMKFTIENFGNEPVVYSYTYHGEIVETKLSNRWDCPVFDYHGFPGVENRNFSDRTVNHFGVEWELDFKNRMNFYKTIRALIKAGIMFNEDNTKFNIIPMHDGSLCGGFPVEIIFAADTLEGITSRLNKAKAIFNKFGVKSSTEVNRAGIHITQDFDYLKGNAFYYLCKYIGHEIPLSDYLQHTKRNPNGYCIRCNIDNYHWITDGDNYTLDMTYCHRSDRYLCLNITNAQENRLEWRMFNSCCDPVECINWINELNEKFNAIAKNEIESRKVGA